MPYRKCCASCFHWQQNDTFGRCLGAASPFNGKTTNGEVTSCDSYEPMPHDLPPDSPRLALINPESDAVVAPEPQQSQIEVSGTLTALVDLHGTVDGKPLTLTIPVSGIEITKVGRAAFTKPSVDISKVLAEQPGFQITGVQVSVQEEQEIKPVAAVADV